MTASLGWLQFAIHVIFLIYIHQGAMASSGTMSLLRRHRQLQNTSSTAPTTSRPQTTAAPTVTFQPTVTNSSLPSSAPTYSITNSSVTESNFQHTVYVSEQRVMSDFESNLYELIMENLTYSIGYEVGDPLIVPNCTVTDSRVAAVRKRSTRRLQDALDGNVTEIAIEYALLVSFTMNYISRYGYDTKDYPEQLRNYINENTAQMTEYLKVINIGSTNNYIVKSGIAYIFQMTDVPTTAPTGSPSMPPSFYLTEAPSGMPSMMPSMIPPPRLGAGGIAGIVIGTLFSLSLMVFMGRKICKSKHAKEEMGINSTGGNNNYHNNNENGASDEGAMFVAVTVNNGAMDEPPSIERAARVSVLSNVPSHSGGENNTDFLTQLATAAATVDSQEYTSITSPNSTEYSLSTDARSKQYSKEDTFTGANLLMRDDSFSTDSNDEALSPQNDVDEFDQYKLEVLKQLREEVERTIVDVDSMMSLAMTQIFMEAEGTHLDLSWVGAEDPASIEASCYYEAFDWKKQQVVEGTCEDFFQQMLNRIVQIVHRGLIRPHDGARLLHGCASILDMQLLREIPKTIVAIRGLRKTNDLAQGHDFLVKSLSTYGEIIDASISPKNKGFGFVRFVQPHSVLSLMKKYESTEIEIQDVSVSIIPIQ